MEKRKKYMADESEMFVNFRAMRLSWLFLTLMLIVWSLYEVIKTGEPGIQFLILCVSTVIFCTAKLIITKKLTKDDSPEDDAIEE